MAWQAKPFVWQGKTLAPFAIDREGDWLLHRALINAPGLGVVFGQGSAFLHDACRILFFCAHDPDVWLAPADDAQEAARVLEKRIRAWAVDAIPPGEQTAAVTMALEIYNRAHTTRAVAKPDRSINPEHSGN